MRFKRYFESLLFIEMPAVRQENKFEFDEYDDHYLKPFEDYIEAHYKNKLDESDYERLMIAVLAKAISYRYGPKTLIMPHTADDSKNAKHFPDERAVKIQSGITKQDGTPLNVKFEVHVNTNARQLIGKFKEKGYELDKINITRDTATRLATHFLERKLGKPLDPKYKRGDITQPPALKQAYAVQGYQKGGWTPGGALLTSGGRKPFADKEGESPGSAASSDHRGEMKYKEDIPLDADDRAFIAAFKNNPDERVQRQLIPAFQARYSGRLVNNPEANKSVNGAPAGKIMMWPINKNFAIPVPVNLPALKAKLEDLKEKGVNFFNNPLPRQSAIRWIDSEVYKPGAKAKRSVQTIEKAKNQKYTLIQKWVHDQEDYLTDPENIPNPNITSGKDKEATEGMGWYDILDYDAEQGARKALTYMQGQTKMPLKDIDLEELKNHALDHLTSDEVVGRPDYAHEAERINMAFRIANQFIKNFISDRKGGVDTEMGAVASKNNDEDQKEIDKMMADVDIPSERDVSGMKLPPEMAGSVPALRQYLQQNLNADTAFNHNPDTLNDAATMLAKMIHKLRDLNDAGELNDGKVYSLVMHKMASDVVEIFKKKKEEEPPTEPAKPSVPSAAVQAALAANEPPKAKKLPEPKPSIKPAMLGTEPKKQTDLFSGDDEPAAPAPVPAPKPKVEKPPKPPDRPGHITKWHKGQWIYVPVGRTPPPASGGTLF